MVLANPEIANLPNWVIAFIAAGGLAAALSTAAGLLLVIASAISHDLMGQVIFKDKETGKSSLNEKTELMWARISLLLPYVLPDIWVLILRDLLRRLLLLPLVWQLQHSSRQSFLGYLTKE